MVKLCEATQEVDIASTPEALSPDDAQQTGSEYRDMREALFNGSTLRNDIEIFRFEPDELSGFGAGGAVIASVRILDADGTPLSWIVGGEDVSLEMRCTANQDLLLPIVGFQFKDRLGQVIFADNTFLAYQFNAPQVEAGEKIIARFDFRMPVLPSGDYSVDVALANGSQESHVQHHWVHDALIVRVHASSVCFGLFGIPMKAINIKIEGRSLHE